MGEAVRSAVRHVSLFSGVGGIDLGFERAGLETVAQCEIDPHARKVLAERFGVPMFDDVREVTADDLPAFDVLSGGFPCQDISVAGRRAGLDGDRSGLWFEFARIIAESAPLWVLIENVAGLLSSNGGRDLGTILGWLEEHGYRWAYRVLDSQWFGVAQRRRRVFIVAGRGGRSPGRVLFEPESGDGDSAPSREARQESAGTVAYGVTAGSPNIAGTFGSLMGGHRTTDIDGAGAYVVESEYGPECLHCGAYGGDHLCDHCFDDVAGPLTAGMHRWPRGTEAIDSNHLVPFTQNQGARIVSSVNVRRLMPVECERLQGFPDGWSSDLVTKTQAYRQMGNAVTVPVAEWIGRRLMEQA